MSKSRYSTAGCTYIGKDIEMIGNNGCAGVDNLNRLSRRTGKEKAAAVCGRIFPYVLLSVFTLSLCLLPIPADALFGSEGDWYSQHVGAAENLRQMMLETGSIFPQYSVSGGGCSIYDYAYYGFFRPDVLLSCLMPEIEMKYIISAYALFSVTASVCLCFYWLKKQGLNIVFSMGGAAILASAACFFQAHHQIIFVNYMPFLILALVGIDQLIDRGRILLLTTAAFLICIHSFFYAPTCAAVCLLYLVCQLRQKKALRTLSLRWIWGKAVLAAATAVSLAAVLLLPTALNILSTTKDSGAFEGLPSEIVDIRLDGLLYSPYGCGMTLLSLYCLLLSLTRKKRRMLASALLLCFLLPVVSFLFNGFLYSRGKILIPFLPLIVWICADTLEELFSGKTKFLLLPAVLCFLPAFSRSAWQSLLPVDGAILLIWVFLLRFVRLPEKIRRSVFALILLVPMCVNLGVNSSEKYLKESDTRQKHFTRGDITMFVSDRRYRFDVLANNFVNSNVPADGSIWKTSMYSSITNQLYADFYYNTMRNPISLRNRVVLMPNQNGFFSFFMGTRYVLTREDDIPYGYKRVFRRGGYALAENEQVLPVCYGTYDLLSKEDFDRLTFPETMQALCSAAVVDKEGGRFTPQVKEEQPSELLADRQLGEKLSSAEGIDLSLRKDARYTFKLNKTVRDKALIVSFRVESPKGHEVEISLNGMKNNLSSKHAPYPNKNHTFTFVLSGDSLDKLQVLCTKGEYTVSQLKIFTAELPDLSRRNIAVPRLDEEGQDRDTMFKGVVQMREDGYFITSFPYRRGYEIRVDGVKTDAEKVNTAFVGFPLESGEHRIQIDYRAPGFKAGSAASSAALAAYGLIAAAEIAERRKRR